MTEFSHVIFTCNFHMYFVNVKKKGKKGGNTRPTAIGRVPSVQSVYSGLMASFCTTAFAEERHSSVK